MLKPLVRSLRKHTSAHLIIATNENNDLATEFASDDVTIFRVKPSEGYRPYPALARIEYYLEILAGLPSEIEKLLLVDSRDVIFQADPFENLPKADLIFFAENNDTSSWTLSTTNGRWAWAMLPAKMRAALIGKPIVNGGVIAGNRAGIERMCRAKLDIALQTGEWTKHTTGLDNIATNVIAHTGLAGDAAKVANHEIVANIYRETAMEITAEAMISRPGARPCPIVHMYDRQPDLLKHVYSKYGVQQDPTQSLHQDRSLGKSSVFDGPAHWLKLACIRLTGRA
jgi:hypothetical protein